MTTSGLGTNRTSLALVVGREVPADWGQSPALNCEPLDSTHPDTQGAADGEHQHREHEHGLRDPPAQERAG